MNPNEHLQQFREHTLAALKKIPGARWYALDEAALDSLAIFGIAWQEERMQNEIRFDVVEFEKIIGEIVEAIPSLRQERPAEPKPMPEPWLHPLTKRPLPLPKTPDEKAILAQRDPELLSLLEDLDERPYQALARLHDTEAARARVAAISYSEAEHKTNPFVTNDLPGQGKLVRQSQELADYYKREKRPVTIPWQPGQNNLTEIGRLTKKSAHTRPAPTRISRN